MYLPVYVYVYLSIIYHLSSIIYLSTYQSIYLSTYLFIVYHSCPYLLSCVHVCIYLSPIYLSHLHPLGSASLESPD
jgi:hypothetical protein